MMRLLVDFFSGVVRVLAVVAIFGGAVVGFLQSNNADVEPWAGALIGFAAGFLIASVGGGILACLILIESHLRVLADAKKAELKKPPVEEKPVEESAVERAERIAMYARQYRSAGEPAAAPPAPAPAEEKTEQPKAG